MKKIELDELKVIQLDILQVFHEFCIKHNIQYSLGGGTLLGAIRHNGYIPWDDDIDVYMKRSEYKKFLEIFPETYQECYKLAVIERDKTWNRPYGKLYDIRSILKELKTSNEPDLGVNIDIFPVDYVPSNEKEWHKYNKKRKTLLALLFSKTTTLRSNRSFMKNFNIFLLKCVSFFIPIRILGKTIDKYAQRYDGIENKYLFTTVQGWRIKKPYSASTFDSVELHRFEDREFYIMSGYDEALKNLYGDDYMLLPPENKRITHYYIDAYWK